MGRPLKKSFFEGLGKAGFQIGCTAWFTGQGSSESAYLVQQKSNRKYLVESDAGPGTRSEILKLVNGTPAAAGEMQVTVTPELAAAASQATFTFDTNASGNVSAVAVTGAGSGYFVDGTFNITVASDAGFVAGTEAVIAYTVDPTTQTVTGATVQTAGSGYTASLSGQAVAAGDAPAANTTLDSAKLIHANQVKTFAGVKYVWNASGGTGSGGRGGIPEATLQQTSS